MGPVFMPMGSNFGDIDNDGFLDIYLGSGSLGGGVRRVDVEVTWPVSRTTQRFANVQPNQVLRIRELDDRPVPLPRPRLPLARATAGSAASRPVEVARAR